MLAILQTYACLLYYVPYLFGSKDCSALAAAGERENRVATGGIGGAGVCASGIGEDWVVLPCCAS